MNAQQLKNAILQEAIEGRLVPQDPNDEPASALLARIRKEKERLVKEGKLKKKDLEVKPISEDEIPFEIPESWEWVRLSTLSTAIHYGFTASAAPAGNAKLLRITDIQDDKVNWKSVPFCTTKEKDLDTYQLKNRDILIARTGGTIGKTYIVRQLDEVAVFASYLIRVIPLEEVNEEFLKLFMMTPCYWKQLTDASSGTGQPNVNGQSLSNLILPIPPKEEQIRILSKYEELLPKVEEYGKAQDALNKLNAELPERLKKSILQEAIEGRLVAQDPNDEPASVLLDKIRAEKKQLVKEGKLKKKDLEEIPISEDEKPFEIPKGWVWVRWGALGEYKKGPFGSSLTKSMFVPKSDKAIKVYEQKNAIQKDYSLGEYYISEEKYEEMKGFTIHPGDIIVSCAGTIGETYLLPQEAPVGIINQALMRAKIHLESIIPYWLLYFRYILLIENRLKGAGSAIKNIPPFEVLKAMPVALPPLAEQKRIVAKIEEVFKEIDKLKK
jgi:type I restriction enzyme S subunit